MKNLFVILVATILSVGCAAKPGTQTEAENVGVIPYPLKVVGAEGSCDLSGGFRITGNGARRDYLESVLQADHDLEPARRGMKINLRLDKKWQGGDEAYRLEVKKSGIKIVAGAKTGLFYGMQTLRQLINDGQVPCMTIEDEPRFAWRAYMLDEARWFQGAETVKRLLDEMALLKLNTFHWHLTNDAGWRIEIDGYPLLTEVGGTQPDSVVTHGSGWFRIEFGGQILNLVSAHLWPMTYGFGVKQGAVRDASATNNDGDKYRRMEIEYICTNTIGSVPDAAEQLWLMAGDFNSQSRHDNTFYNHPEESPRFLTQDYIEQQTPYIDVIAQKYPGEFKASMFKPTRIDYIYCTPALYDRMVSAEIIVDDYTQPVNDTVTNFKHPSDHLPIVAEFKF